jgi:Protein of unknown function (DUF2975)
MQPYRSDPVVRGLTAVVSLAYFVVLVGGGVALLGLPAARMWARGQDNWTLELPVPATAGEAEATVQTIWGPARLVVDDARGDLQLPIDAIPWRIVALIWLYLAVGLGLMVLTLYHLRRIFQRVRDGAPFDAQNALRLRTVGLLLLAAGVYDVVMELVASSAVRRGLVTGDVTVARGIHVDATMFFVALGLVALAEVFRRGAELEDEQALVV